MNRKRGSYPRKAWWPPALLALLGVFVTVVLLARRPDKQFAAAPNGADARGSVANGEDHERIRDRSALEPLQPGLHTKSDRPSPTDNGADAAPLALVVDQLTQDLVAVIDEFEDPASKSRLKALFPQLLEMNDSQASLFVDAIEAMDSEDLHRWVTHSPQIYAHSEVRVYYQGRFDLGGDPEMQEMISVAETLQHDHVTLRFFRKEFLGDKIDSLEGARRYLRLATAQFLNLPRDYWHSFGQDMLKIKEIYAARGEQLPRFIANKYIPKLHPHMAALYQSLFDE